ncbi:hypothetical protein R1flu_004377 [Riccia fluitans]|uniref:Retrovirus-related Pol polyprotein from transposon TNT 1-94 n=1 Tax=Riccia fluitans TaxID=41844 RepID=A0ABD1YQ48_9MARC
MSSLQKLESLRMVEGTSMENHFAVIKKIDEYSYVGGKLDDDHRLFVILRSLPQAYSVFKTAMCLRQNEAPVSFTELQRSAMKEEMHQNFDQKNRKRDSKSCLPTVKKQINRNEEMISNKKISFRGSRSFVRKATRTESIHARGSCLVD